ncbi:MAG: neutral/alkaline non-lysosomal ceramidase N-terminal domain-containing protein [Anaerolineae bacterium]
MTASQGALLAAVGSVDITPPVGYYLGGYGARSQPSNAIHDRLHGRVLLLANGDTRAAIVTLDLLGLKWDTNQQTRQAIAAAAGLSPDSVLINCSHTHSGPDTRRYDAYLGYVAEQLAGAATVAAGDLQPVTVSYGQDSIDFNVNRRRRDAAGTMQMWPNPEGPVDRRARVLRFDTQTRQPLAVLLHVVCHANALSSENLAISADFPGLAQQFVGEAFPGSTPMFVQGCTGNARPWITQGDGFRTAGEPDLRWCGYCAGAAAVQAAARAASSEHGDRSLVGSELAVAQSVLSLPSREGGQIEYPVQALRLGRVLLVALAGEPVLDFATTLEQRLQGWDQVIVAGYSNAMVGYVAPAYMFPEGGYEVSQYANHFTPECFDTIVAEAESLANGLGPNE